MIRIKNEVASGADKPEPPHTNNFVMPYKSSAKVYINKDICKCLAFFRYTIGTTLDCAKSTGILRNSITWYVSYLEESGLLKMVCRKADTTTGRMAKHYSADVSQVSHNYGHGTMGQCGTPRKEVHHGRI